jgi:hypothetical protein
MSDKGGVVFLQHLNYEVTNTDKTQPQGSSGTCLIQHLKGPGSRIVQDV